MTYITNLLIPRRTPWAMRSSADTTSAHRLRLLFLVGTVLAIWLLAFEQASATAKRPATQYPYIINNKVYYPIPSAKGYAEKGVASWYGGDFHGRRTSNGEIYDMYSMTAAHKILPMNTMLLVRNLENGKQTIVRVNDRGPFVRGRIIDLSYTAAQKLGVVSKGTAKVQVVALAEGQRDRSGHTNLIFKDPNVGEFYVQIGAFAKKMNALKLQKRFTDAGHTTVIQKYFGPEPLFRVQVYVGKTLQHARRAEQALLDHGYVGAFIIAR